MRLFAGETIFFPKNDTDPDPIWEGLCYRGFVVSCSTPARAHISECGVARMAEDCPLAAQKQGEVEGDVEGGGDAATGDELLVSFT